ncbi:MAG: fatty acid desaturase, partial [Polaromonas sp.]|nr:fatty acid desaturase [Polaromonas sp.]
MHPRPALIVPHRKIIRSWLVPVSGKNTALALGLAGTDLVLFGGLLAATVLLPQPLLQLVAGLLAGLVIGRLFILGHDACHQSFTPHRRLNRWLGRLLFLPSLTPYSLWDVGHNVVHHGYTNLRAFDFVWQPLSLEAYQGLSPRRRLLERIYRSGWAPGLYYALDIWWKRMFFPSRTLMPTRRAVFIADGLLVAGTALAWVGLLVWAASATGQSALWLVGVAFAWPIFVWKALIGFVVYVHHTHTSVAWYDKKEDWAAASPFVSTTVHLSFPAGI